MLHQRCGKLVLKRLEKTSGKVYRRKLWLTITVHQSLGFIDKKL